MPGSLSRPAVAAAVLLTTGLVGVAGAGGASSAVPASRVTYGPVALPAPPRPLVDVQGPLLPSAPVWAAPPVGPRAVAAALGPPAEVGPHSPPQRVRAVQRLLNRAGASLRVDGAWGAATARAVRALQARHGLPVSGRADARVLVVLGR